MHEDSKDVDDDMGANVAAATLEDLKGGEGGEGRTRWMVMNMTTCGIS